MREATGPAAGPAYTPAGIVQVTGGAHDPVVLRAEELAVEYASARRLADAYDAAGNRMRGWAARGARTMADPELLKSALLSPWSFAEAEAAVVLATTGPDGIGVESVLWEADALAVRAAVELMEERDRLAHYALETLDYALGRAIGTALPGLLLSAGLAAALAAPQAVRLGAVWSVLPEQVRAAAADRGQAGLAEVEEWLADRPELLRHLANGGGGVLDGLAASAAWLPGVPLLPMLHPTTEDAARSLSWLRRDEGPPRVAAHPPPEHLTPSSLRELMQNLAAVNGTGEAPQPDGAVSVQRVVGAEGDRRWIVYAPGTDDLHPLHHDETIRDGGTNLLLVAGQDTGYGAGILTAMRAAGVGRDEPVLLVGHSQGGMQAVHLAGQDTGFRITHVVTAGAPTAQADLPVPGDGGGPRVLSLEHAGDVVPLVTGEENRATRGHVTVRFEDPTPSGNTHGMEHYVRGATAAEASADPGVIEQLASLRGFLAGGESETHGYVISR